MVLEDVEVCESFESGRKKSSDFIMGSYSTKSILLIRIINSKI